MGRGTFDGLQNADSRYEAKYDNTGYVNGGGVEKAAKVE